MSNEGSIPDVHCSSECNVANVISEQNLPAKGEYKLKGSKSSLQEQTDADGDELEDEPNNASRKRKCETKHLTDQEKLQRRLEANRKSAAKSRKRRLDSITEMKSDLGKMSEELLALTKENEELLQELVLVARQGGMKQRRANIGGLMNIGVQPTQLPPPMGPSNTKSLECPETFGYCAPSYSETLDYHPRSNLAILDCVGPSSVMFQQKDLLKGGTSDVVSRQDLNLLMGSEHLTQELNMERVRAQSDRLRGIDLTVHRAAITPSTEMVHNVTGILEGGQRMMLDSIHNRTCLLTRTAPMQTFAVTKVGTVSLAGIPPKQRTSQVQSGPPF